MDRMSEAIEGADVICYGVSNAYKESANCRLEANCDLQLCVQLPDRCPDVSASLAQMPVSRNAT